MVDVCGFTEKFTCFERHNIDDLHRLTSNIADIDGQNIRTKQFNNVLVSQQITATSVAYNKESSIKHNKDLVKILTHHFAETELVQDRTTIVRKTMNSCPFSAVESYLKAPVLPFDCVDI